MRVAKSIFILLMVMLFLAGLSVVSYPLIQGIVAENNMAEETQLFLKNDSPPSSTIASSDVDVPPQETEFIPTQYPELWYVMSEYNEKIWDEKQTGLSDPWAYTQPAFSLAGYGLDSEVFGVISIPKLDLEMPLYLGATNQHMAKGAAQLSQTSIPIGGINTNSVIAGHRGYGGAAYFRYITELEPGDEVQITTLWGVNYYSVSHTKIIAPNDIEEILIQEGKDMITLLTCHPYASGGRQRYLVFCERSDKKS